MSKTQETLSIQIDELFRLQKEHAPELKRSNYRSRIAKLDLIYQYLSKTENENRLCTALYRDFKKPRAESISSEIGVILTAIKFIKRNLRSWMDKEYVPTPLMLTGASSYIIYEPKGVCLIIGPWNYPFQLAINPLLYAITAGNTAIIKPSEYPTNTSAFIKSMIESLFDPKEVTVVEGGIPVSQALLALPFDHIYFTGSPKVGKMVMQSAAKHLSSVTLELGGKSPCIIDASANLKKAARRTVWGKFLNGGQTCIAPDYVLVHESVKEEFLSQLKDNIKRMYDPDGKGIQNSPDLCRIINLKNHRRANDLLKDAIQKGANLYYGGEVDESDLYISPTILSEVTNEMDIMHEEIFSPILPVISFNDKAEAASFIGQKPKPLALYIHARNKKNIEFYLKETSAGGSMINDFHAYYANPHLPFGGVNNSGFGKTHGIHGFKEFSNARPVMHQKWGLTDLLHPPYGKNTLRILKWMIRLG